MLAGPSISREAACDTAMVTLAVLHGLALAAWPSPPLIALGVWWTSNTIAHNFIHRPFFHARTANRLFALYLTATLGIPQTLWRSRHLAHHAGAAWRLRVTRDLACELLLVAGLWTLLALVAPRYLLGSYLPGLAIGLGLCAIHGHGEHAGGTASYRGRLYNLLFLNDGYHAEHHEAPGVHWSRLPRVRPAGRESRWPPVLRWLEAFSLVGLERVAMRFRPARHFLLATHERAFRRVLARMPEPRAVAIVGGGLFPRTALILEKLLPRSRLAIIDRDAAHLDIARNLVGERVKLVHATFDASKRAPYDLVILPLSFQGDRQTAYRCPPAPAVLVHDWLWRRRGRSAVISVLLLKRLNLCTALPLPSRTLSRSLASGRRQGLLLPFRNEAPFVFEAEPSIEPLDRLAKVGRGSGRGSGEERATPETSPGRSRTGPGRSSGRPSSR